MIIGGYQRLTLIDYPGKLATTVFTVGCSFKCSFCHNPELVLADKMSPHSGNDTEQEFFKFLEKRKGKLDGVCITGGEPTIQQDIIPFIEKVKALGFLVKLDSNGTRPDVLKKIIDRKLVDYLAMDIKHCADKYHEVVGINFDMARVKMSVRLIMQSGIPYEFRTTVVPGIHNEEDFECIAKWIDGAARYYLQEFRDIKILDPTLRQRAQGKTLDLEKIKAKIQHHFGLLGVRR